MLYTSVMFMILLDAVSPSSIGKGENVASLVCLLEVSIFSPLEES
jgi:hypothetical protein